MTRIGAITACGALAITTASAEPPPSDLDKAVFRIDATARETRSIAADFTQRNRMKLFKQELTSKGRLLYRAPRQIRWEYTQPDPSVLLLDGSTATMRTPGAEAQTFDLGKDATMRAVFDQLLTFVGGGSIAQVYSAYDVQLVGKVERPTLKLTPLPSAPAAKSFSRIELAFDDKALVKTIRLVEKNGDEKEITFTKVERNGALPKDSFR